MREKNSNILMLLKIIKTLQILVPLCKGSYPNLHQSISQGCHLPQSQQHHIHIPQPSRYLYFLSRQLLVL